MRCKRHPHEQGAGVCASCLRDRLLALQAAQNGASPGAGEVDEISCRYPPPPVLLPRSASPHRRSTDSDASIPDPLRRRRRFRHSPQVGDHRSSRKFSLFSSLFHHHHGRDNESEAASAASNSWFSSLIHGRTRKKNKKTRRVSSSSPPLARKMKAYAVSDRGMSPVRGEETDDNASDSGYSTESSATWRRKTTAQRAADRHRSRGGGFAGFTVCLSPLVRPGAPSRRTQPPDVGFSGELRSKAGLANNRHVSSDGGSFGPNRSRKLADRGRFR